MDDENPSMPTMEANCTYLNFDSGPCEVYSETFPIARKIHKCCECGQDIQPHQKYHKYRGCWDGTWDTFKTCMTCYRIRNTYCFNGFIFGELQDILQDCLDINYLKVPK